MILKPIKAALLAPISLLIIATSSDVSARSQVNCTALEIAGPGNYVSLALETEERTALRFFYRRAQSNHAGECAWSDEQTPGLRSILSPPPPRDSIPAVII